MDGLGVMAATAVVLFFVGCIPAYYWSAYLARRLNLLVAFAVGVLSACLASAVEAFLITPVGVRGHFQDGGWEDEQVQGSFLLLLGILSAGGFVGALFGSAAGRRARPTEAAETAPPTENARGAFGLPKYPGRGGA